MNSVLILISLVIGLGLAIAVTVAAVRAVRRGGSVWKAQAVEPKEGFTFAGLLAFEDPVRDGVREAVHACADAGIRVIMITGDHPGTAAAIAREVGLGGDHPRVVLMEDLARDPSRMPDRLLDVDVVARAIPAQKLDLVRTLQG